MSTTTNDERLGRGVDENPVAQHEVYLVLTEEERAAGFLRPVRRSYIHKTCGCVTTMGIAIAETYARNPNFYGATYCVACAMHLPVNEFLWDGTNEEVGS